jgi:hypothetical protein
MIVAAGMVLTLPEPLPERCQALQSKQQLFLFEFLLAPGAQLTASLLMPWIGFVLTPASMPGQPLST